jgi:hypothetical protein
MKPLPDAIFIDPKKGLRELWKVTRFQSERDSLVIRFALEALGGKGPYSVLVITGEPLLLAPNSSRDV